jgi:hypothetical protein
MPPFIVPIMAGLVGTPGWTLKSSASNGAAGTSGSFNVGPINTTGADLFVACYGGGGTNVTPSDSASNTWSVATQQQASGVSQIHYVARPTTSSSHTFTFPLTYYNSAVVLAYSGSLATPLDQAASGGGATPPSITPTQGNELVVAMYSLQSSNPPYTINQGFTARQTLDYSAGVYYGIIVGDLVQAVAAALNPSLSPSAPAYTTAIASFKV